MRAWIVSLALLGGMAGADAAACRVEIDPEASDHERLFELQMQPACAAEVARLMSKVEAELAQPLQTSGLSEEDAEYASEERLGLMTMVAAWKLREALRAGDIAGARKRIGELTSLTSARDQDEGDELPEQLTAILGVLDGRVPPPDPRKGPAAKPDWVLQYGFCGTPLVMYRHAASSMPTAADAWLALGRPDLAISQLLADEWEIALSLGTAPPRLREYVEAMLGPGSWEREVRVALQGIRLRHEVDGVHASLPLLGYALPLPVGYKSWHQEHAVMFTSPAEIAEQVRESLLGSDAD